MKRLRILALVVALVAMLVPQTSQAAVVASTSWSPNRIVAVTLDPSGILVRGQQYTTSVTVTALGADIDNAEVIVTSDRGVEITADQSTVTLAMGESTDLELTITISDQATYDRKFSFAGRVRLVGERAVGGSLPISLTLPQPRIRWQRGNNEIRVPSGTEQAMTLVFTSTTTIDDFQLRSSKANFVSVEVPTSVAAGEQVTANLVVNAPATSRGRKTMISLSAFDGTRRVPTPFQLRVVLLPLTFTWDPPDAEQEIDYGANPIMLTVRVMSNYDVDGIEFRTRDVGLAPIVSPVGLVNMTAGAPRDIQMEISGTYAPSRYFVTIVPYKGGTVLGNALRLRVNVVETRT